MLHGSIIELLDKLYNYRSDDSVITSNIDGQIEDARNKKEENTDRSISLIASINELSSEENLLMIQGDKLKNIFNSVNNSDYSKVIEKLNLNFNLEEIQNELNEKLPQEIERITSEVASNEAELKEVEENIAEYAATIEDLLIRKDEALANQERLNRYFELALSSSVNITREEISSLLSRFDLTEDEQKEASKLLMFPEDGLFEYENMDHSVKNKTIKDVLIEAKSGDTSYEYKPDVEIENDSKDEYPSYNNIDQPESTFEERSLDNLSDLLKGLNINVSSISRSELEKMSEYYDPDVVNSNVEYLKNIAFNEEALYDNIKIICDSELKAKIDLLLENNKSYTDICLNANVLTKYTLAQLQDAIKVLEDSGLDPKMVPLMAY